jgi:hypothetical protein
MIWSPNLFLNYAMNVCFRFEKQSFFDAITFTKHWFIVCCFSAVQTKPLIDTKTNKIKKIINCWHKIVFLNEFIVRKLFEWNSEL